MGVAGNKAICKNITMILGYLIKVIVLANLMNLEFYSEKQNLDTF
jgi:hypothetical protein